MKQILIFLCVVFASSNLCAQKYLHYYMNDDTFYGFYTSDGIEIEHDAQGENTTISYRKKYKLPLKNIEKIAIEDVYITDNFDGDYRIYEETFENEFFKKIIVDTRANLFASKNGDFGANDTILYSSVYFNKPQVLFITDSDVRIKKVFYNNSLYYYDYNNDVLDNIVQIAKNGEIIEHPEWVASTQYDVNASMKHSLKISKDVLSFFYGLATSSANFGAGEFAQRYHAIKDNPELHNQMLILDGLLIAGDIAGIAGSFLTGIPTGGLTWAGIGIGVGLLGSDMIALYKNMFPDSNQMEKYREYYQNKYSIVIKTVEPDVIDENSANIYGSLSTSNGIKGELYFFFSNVHGADDNKRISAGINESIQSTYIVNAIVDDLQPEENYVYTLCYECIIDGLTLSFASDNETIFNTGSRTIFPFPVDLGLPSGTKWANCNLGAEEITGLGGLYGWGDSSGEKTSTSFADYPTNEPPFCISNTEYDIAKNKWGKLWSIPTAADFRELTRYCKISYVEEDGVKCLKAVGPNGNYILLPYAGYRSGSELYDIGKAGRYWTGDAGSYDDGELATNAYDFYFYDAHNYIGDGSRYCGRSIRPVFKGVYRLNAQ